MRRMGHPGMAIGRRSGLTRRRRLRRNRFIVYRIHRSPKPGMLPAAGKSRPEMCSVRAEEVQSDGNRAPGGV